MTKSDFNKALTTICQHSRILFSGFKRMIFGALTAGLFAIALYGFYLIPSEDGYAAVTDFVASTATLVVAVACTYAQGTFRKTKGERRGGSK